MAQLAARGMRADVDTGGPPPRTRLFDLSVGLVEDVRERATVCDSAESFSPRFQVALPGASSSGMSAMKTSSATRTRRSSLPAERNTG